MVSEKTEPVALAVNKLKSLAKSTQAFTNGILHNFGFPNRRRRHPIEILKRLQREAFSDIMKLRDRQDKVERLLSFKASKAAPFAESGTRVRGEVEVLGLLLMIDRINEENEDAISRTGIRTGINSRFTFETSIRENDSLVAEFVASNKGQLDGLNTSLSLAKVVFNASVNDWCSLAAIPLGARCSDIGLSESSHREYSFSGPPLLNQHIGTGFNLTVKKSNIIASLAQFVSPLESPLTTHCLSTFWQVVYQLTQNTKLSLLSLHKVPKFSSQHASLGPLALPIGLFSRHKTPVDPHHGSLGSMGLVFESELDSSTRIGGWVEMNNSGARNWGVSVSDMPEYEFGWGLRLGGVIDGFKNLNRYEIEGFSKIKFGEKFCLKPSLMYVIDGSTRFPALLMKSSWSF